MRIARSALAFALPCLLTLAGCEEDATGPDDARLSLQIVSSPDAPVAVDSVAVHLDGPETRRLGADDGETVVLTHLWPEESQGEWWEGGTSFGGWSGDCEGFDRCTLTMDGAKEVVAAAAAELVTYFLVPRIDDLDRDGWRIPGLVIWPLRWNELGTDCRAEILYNDGANGPNHCSARMAPGTRISFTSPQGPVDWGDSCDIVEGTTCRVVVRSDFQSTLATWDWSPPDGHSILEIMYYGGTDGIVRSDLPGIYPDTEVRGSEPVPYPLECGATEGFTSSILWLQCSQVHPNGTTVTLTASPHPGFEFTGWSGGGCSGVGPCVVVMDQSYEVTPSFAPVETTSAAARSDSPKR